MKKKVGGICTLLTASLVLTGCWDLKSVSDYNFVTALGIDYAEGKYTIYAELMDFGNMGSQEKGTSGVRSEVWIGKSEGNSLYQAINEMYKTSQQSLYWDHLMAIVFSESALKNDINAFIDSIPRFPQIRYNSWVFGTQEPINELFKNSTFVNFSPIANLLHNPKVLHNQLSTVAPIRLNTVLANAGEKGQVDLIPSLILKKRQWEDTEKSQTVLQMNGAYVLNNGKAEKKFSEKQLNGVRWTNTKTRRASLPIFWGGKQFGTVSIFNPKKIINVTIEKGEPVFTMDLMFTGVVEEVLEPSMIKQFRELAEKEIAEEVVQTYRNGISNHTDIYGFQQSLYRQKPQAWKSVTSIDKNNGLSLAENSLRKVKVNVKIAHSGMYDLEP